MVVKYPNAASRSMLPPYPEAVRRKLARNVILNTLRMHRGENLLIETWSATLDWAESFVLEARIVGARPMLVVEDEPTLWKSVEEAPAAHVGRVGSHEWAALKATDAHVYLYGPLETAREEALPDSIVGRINADDHEWFRLVEKHGIRSARWDLGRTSALGAERYGVDLESWRRELVEAASVDPRTLQKDGQRIARALRTGREVTITHPNGTELTLHLTGRAPRVDDGVIDDDDIRAGNVMTVVPSGVVQSTVKESEGEGTFVANVPGVMFLHGRESALRPGRWEFRRGRLAEYHFDSGAEEFRRAQSTLGAGKDRPGMISVGLNPAISSIPLLVDQEKGVVTVAIGRNAHLGGQTRTPHFTAYLSVRGATLRIDGRTLVDHGELG